MRMKKILLLTFLIVGLTLTFAAGKASATLLATSMVEAQMNLDSLSIVTSGGDVTYDDTYLYNTQSGGAASNLTAEVPFEYSTNDWETANTGIVAISDVDQSSAEGEAGLDGTNPIYNGGQSPFTSGAHIFADASAEVQGVAHYSSWAMTGLGAELYGGALGGDITVTLDYFLNIELTSTVGYDAWGYSSATIYMVKNYGELGEFEDSADDNLFADVWDGDSSITKIGIDDLATLSLTFHLEAEEYGSLWIGVYSSSNAGHESFDVDAVPEPATIALLGIGLVGLAGAAVRRRFKRKAKS